VIKVAFSTKQGALNTYSIDTDIDGHVRLSPLLAYVNNTSRLTILPVSI